MKYNALNSIIEKIGKLIIIIAFSISFISLFIWVTYLFFTGAIFKSFIVGAISFNTVLFVILIFKINDIYDILHTLNDSLTCRKDKPDECQE